MFDNIVFSHKYGGAQKVSVVCPYQSVSDFVAGVIITSIHPCWALLFYSYFFASLGFSEHQALICLGPQRCLSQESVALAAHAWEPKSEPMQSWPQKSWMKWHMPVILLLGKSRQRTLKLTGHSGYLNWQAPGSFRDLVTQKKAENDWVRQLKWISTQHTHVYTLIHTGRWRCIYTQYRS